MLTEILYAAGFFALLLLVEISVELNRIRAEMARHGTMLLATLHAIHDAIYEANADRRDE